MRPLILPCETRVREFDAKLLLACRAAARGVVSVVGSKKAIDLNLTRYPGGVYVGKSATARSRHNLQIARASGHRVALWDEEGLVWASRTVYWRTKVDGKTLSEPELLIAWGEENAAAWREHPDYTGVPIAAAGNPRTDLLRPELAGFFAERQREIKRRHGAFVLVNTNFSRVNHLQPGQNRHLKWLRERRPDDPRGGFAAHKQALFNSFRDTLPRLARALPDVNFVLRPHPSERRQTWRELMAGLDNVAVDAEGNAIPWLRASCGLIHNGCTTAVEAFVIGRAALAWMPVRSPDYDHPLPNGISLQLDDFDQLVERTRQVVSEPDRLFAEQAAGGGRSLLQRNLAGADGALASERILDALAPLLEAEERPDGARPRLAGMALGLRRAWRAVDQHVPGHGNHKSYLEHMFPATRADEVRARVEGFRRCLADIPRLSVKPLQPNVFRIGPS